MNDALCFLVTVQETSFYVFNRVENGSIRWVSYQETQEQELLGRDDELFGIINLGKEDP